MKLLRMTEFTYMQKLKQYSCRFFFFILFIFLPCFACLVIQHRSGQKYLRTTDLWDVNFLFHQSSLNPITDLGEGI